jgi:UDP-N-acetylmuramoyl-L-alanyl-D-glutamate--2,6-diaminopimelate ligase
MKVKFLRDILLGINAHEMPGFEDMHIKKITYDSRKVEDSSLFVAIKGYSTDGHNYLLQAEQKGAAAAIVEKKDDRLHIPQILVSNSRLELARIATNFYSPEIMKVRLIGITGTNGKTTTSFLIRSIMNKAGLKSGLIGTIAYDVAGNWIKAWNTTPESNDLCRMIYEMHNKGYKGCVLEVSSHALELNRVDFLNFEVALFTNLTQDHLDFHENLNDYFKAKKKLFTHLSPAGRAVINIDDPFGRKLISDLNRDIISFGISDNATVRALEWQNSIAGLNLNINTAAGELHINSSLIGRFNIENILAAVAGSLALNFDLKTIKQGIEAITNIPGRLEVVKMNEEKTVVVDYAHTPDALQKALSVLRELTPNTLWVVFGCGGDRDKAKRPVMGKIAQDFADQVVITSDNPRSEDPREIVDMIVQGMLQSNQIHIELDRRRAIAYAIRQSKTGDTILIAGKGHEDYQDIGGVKNPFDDRTVVREIIK